MKLKITVCLYSENLKVISKSGLGRAIIHQTKILENLGIKITNNYLDDYDVLLINTVGLRSKKIIKIAKKKKAKIVYFAHSTYEDFKDSFVFSNQLAPFYKKWITRLYQMADHILVSSEHNKRLIGNYSNIDKNQITVISNGINSVINEEDKKKNINAFYKYFKLSGKKKVIVSAGLLIKRKGLKDFIEMAKEFPKYTFIWFGETKWYLRQIKINYYLFKSVSLPNLHFPGYIKGPIFNGALAGANLFFFPSKEEGEGISLLEALANNQTCLIRDIDAYKPWTTNNVNCYKFNNETEMKTKIKEIMTGKITKLKEQPREVAIRKDIKSISLEYKDFLTKLLFL